MKPMRILSVAALVLVSACGLENLFGNINHDAYDRPAAKIRGAATYNGAKVSNFTVTDNSGNPVAPFLSSVASGAYELQLPSNSYSMLEVHATSGNFELRAIVPSAPPESVTEGVDLTAANMTETLITEARLSADGSSLKQITPSAYLATRTLIRAAIAGPTGTDPNGHAAKLNTMVQRLLDNEYSPNLSVSSPNFFNVPTMVKNGDGSYSVTSSPIDKGWLPSQQYSFLGDSVTDLTTVRFDNELAAAAALFNPGGCPDAAHIRLVFTSDFNSGGKNGVGGTINRFAWATDKPGKSMFFVGWIHKDSDLQENDPDPQVAADVTALSTALGNSTPNSIPMHDDGTGGDETGGDNVWTVSFVAPRSRVGKVLRIGYKFTWGFQGAPWTGSEEWPGNSRILEVVDDNNDQYVYRHDVFGDEATNKDNANGNPKAHGSIGWTTDLHGCGTPETHENGWDDEDQKCEPVATPKGIGKITVACTGP